MSIGQAILGNYRLSIFQSYIVCIVATLRQLATARKSSLMLNAKNYYYGGPWK